jgi:membrane-bound lytic murein transglycosylase MltF
MMTKSRTRVLLSASAAHLLLALLSVLGCSDSSSAPQREPTESQAAESQPAAGPKTALDGTLQAVLTRRVEGDFDELRKNRVIRALVTYNHTQYFVDGATQRGLAYEALQLFQKHLNEKYDTGTLPIEIVILPVTRADLLERLAQGQGDIAIGALTITDERKKLVDFSTPTITGVKEIVVTGPAGPALATLDDLSGKEVWVRPSSSFRESLEALNARLESSGKDPVAIRPVDETLETEDVLEMVSAGLYGITVADDYLADFWSEVLPDLKMHPTLVLREGGELAWAVRKGSPQLMAEVNEFVTANRKGTATGNVLLKRYLGSKKFARNAFASEDLERLRGVTEFFRKYADQYRFDWLLCAAQGYQESRLDQSVRSPVGAIGVMQVMPETARDPSVGIPNIEEVEPNINAGIKYLRWVVDKYFADPEIDRVNQMLFAFASYNAGPNRIARLRDEATAAGLDRNKWFRNVELVVARRVGREPVQYVANIFKYYVAYTSIAEQLQRERVTGDATGKNPS